MRPMIVTPVTGAIPSPISTQRSRSHWLGLGALVLAAGLGLSGQSPAYAQSCDASQAQLTQAIVDSQRALDRSTATLDSFDRGLISPRTGALDTAPVVAERESIDGYVTALAEFDGQVRPLTQSCGPAFATDAQTLAVLIDRFKAQRSRADQLLSDHQALLDSGEPALTQQQMEGVQQALMTRGFYDSAIDGRFGAGTRASIRAYQSANSLQATGYLSADQVTALLNTPPASSEPSGPAVDGLPPAPYADGSTGQAPTQPADAQSQQICVDNTAQVDRSAERTREYRQDIAGQLGDLRTSLRQSRVGGFDAEAPGRILTDADAYLTQLDDFHADAEAVTGQCGDSYDASVGALGNQIAALRDTRERAAQLAQDYAALMASGEPALSTEEMRQIQRGLANRGHYSGAIDALFGAGTRNAIRAYQAEVGVEQTGYLTVVQAAELQRAAQSQVRSEPETSEPEQVSEPAPITPDQVRARVAEDLARARPTVPFSEIKADDGLIGSLYHAMAASLAQGNAAQVVEERMVLLGTAYMDRSADSLAMADAHLLIADAYMALGLYADASLHLERATGVWAALDRDAAAEQAGLLERSATIALMQALADGTVDTAAAESIGQDLRQARDLVQGALGTDDPLTAQVINRLADLDAATGGVASDAAVSAALEARYPR